MKQTKNIKLSFREFDFNRVCSLDSYIIENESTKKIFKRLLSRIRDLFFRKIDLPSNPPLEFLFFKSMKRDDYNELFVSIYNTCKSNSKLKYDFILTKQFQINFRVMHDLISKFTLIFKLKSSSIIGKIYLYLTSIYCYRALECITHSIKFKYLITFADMQPLDNILTQYSNKRSIPTITLQHGLYIDYSGFRNVNMVNYKNVISDFFLAWGPDTKDLIKKYHPEVEVVICGKPINKKKQHKRSRFFTVVFDQNLFHEYNKKLLRIAYQVSEKIELKVNLRLHPYNKVDWYRINEEITFIDHNISGSAFVIGHTSSLLYELMRLGIPAFKFKSEIPSNFIKSTLVFDDAESLIELTEIRLNKFDFSEYAKIYISYLSNESLKHYENFFLNLKNGTG